MALMHAGYERSRAATLGASPHGSIDPLTPQNRHLSSFPQNVFAVTFHYAGPDSTPGTSPERDPEGAPSNRPRRLTA